MIEHLMVFALGFFTAGLVALVCLPAVWRRALRLTSHRLRQLVPLSADEIAAEHAGLRAQFALDRRRLEQTIEGSDVARSRLMADLGRRDVEVAALRQAAARDAASKAELEVALDTARQALAGLEGQMAAANLALYDLEGLAARRIYDAEEARRTARDLQGRVDRDRASIAAFETRVLGLDTRVADLNQALDKVAADLTRTAAAGRQVTAERDAARQAAEALAGKRDLLAVSVDRLTAQLAQETDKLAAAERLAMERTQAVAAQAETIADLRAQLAMQDEAARASAARVEEMRAEAAARLTSSSQDAELGRLREAIRQVADEVLKMSARA